VRKKKKASKCHPSLLGEIVSHGQIAFMMECGKFQINANYFSGKQEKPKTVVKLLFKHTLRCSV